MGFAWRLLGGLSVRFERAFLRGLGLFALLGLAQLLTDHADTVILEAFVTPAEVGYYGLGLRVLSAMLFVPIVASAVLYPDLATWSSEVARRWWPRLTASLAFTGGLLTLLLFLIAGKFLPLLFGDASTDITPIFLARAPLLAFAFAHAFLSALLQARGKVHLAFWALLLGLALGLAIEGPLAQTFGARGASWSRVAGGAAQALLAGFFVWRMLAKETTPVARQIHAKNSATG